MHNEWLLHRAQSTVGRFASHGSRLAAHGSRLTARSLRSTAVGPRSAVGVSLLRSAEHCVCVEYSPPRVLSEERCVH